MGSSPRQQGPSNEPQSTILGAVPVEGPVGEPDTVSRVSRKANGQIEVQYGLPNMVVISRADLPAGLTIRDSLEKRREDRNSRRKAERLARDRAERLFDVY